MRLLWAVVLVVLPQPLKRVLARVALRWDIHPTARLGRSLVLVRHVSMGPNSVIGGFNIIRGLDELRLAEGASIGTRNRISTHPLAALVFTHSPRRSPVLILGRDAMITNAHEIDCSDRVELKDYARLAGFGCQILTHSLNLVKNRWATGPVELGELCAVMSGCILQNGTRVPARSIVSAGSVVTTRLTEELTFYRGNPAAEVRSLPPTLEYFLRAENAAGAIE